MPTMPRSQCNRFLSTLSLRRATQNALAGVNTNRISIHALLAESDIDAAVEVAHIRNFYPRSPCGERRWSLNQSLTSGLFLSTLSLRRATRPARGSVQQSIHFYPRSPCGERLRTASTSCSSPLISIHALLAESDLCHHMSKNAAIGFLSTLSLRRATLPPHEQKRRNRISIHALLAESDSIPTLMQATGHLFLSTLSLRRATKT